MQRQSVAKAMGVVTTICLAGLIAACSNEANQVQGTYCGYGTMRSHPLDENCEPLPSSGGTAGEFLLHGLQINSTVLGTLEFVTVFGGLPLPFQGTNDNGHILLSTGVAFPGTTYECSLNFLGIDQNQNRSADVLRLNLERESSCVAFRNGQCGSKLVFSNGEARNTRCRPEALRGGEYAFQIDRVEDRCADGFLVPFLLGADIPPATLPDYTLLPASLSMSMPLFGDIMGHFSALQNFLVLYLMGERIQGTMPGIGDFTANLEATFCAQSDMQVDGNVYVELEHAELVSTPCSINFSMSGVR